jgi:hypothetical protein
VNPLQTGIEEILAELKRRTSRGFSDDEVRALLTRLVRYTLGQAAKECENQHLGCQGRHECHDWDAKEIKDLLPG